MMKRYLLHWLSLRDDGVMHVVCRNLQPAMPTGGDRAQSQPVVIFPTVTPVRTVVLPTVDNLRRQTTAVRSGDSRIG